MERRREGTDMFTILVAEDDRELRELFCTVLSENGYRPLEAGDGEEALKVMETEYVDLIISDIMMPHMDGYELTKEIRKANMYLPVLMITAKDSSFYKKEGFQAGTDDYMVKPVDLDELLLRMEALMRRAKITASKKLTVGSLTLDAEERTAYVDGEEVPLTVREFNLLYKLLSYPKKTFTRSQLMDEFWDSTSSSGPRSVDVYMTKLRDKFSQCDDFKIVTVHGLGYKAVLK